MDDIETQVMKAEAWEKRRESPVTKYMGGEVKSNDESIFRWCIVFNNTIRRAEELQASRAGAARAMREGPWMV